MTQEIKVTPEQVRAARIEVDFFESAGLEPDPTVVKLANAEVRSAKLAGRQQQVATLAAAGRSNAEIADLLSVSVATVETHLTHIYRKLGIENRSDLAQHVEVMDAVQEEKGGKMLA